MTQEPLFKDLLKDRLAAIEADIDAAGGKQMVGHKLGLHDDPTEAGKLLSNKIRKNGRHRLSDEEVWSIRQLARNAVGRSLVHEFESVELQADLHWITQQEQMERQEQRLESMMDQFLGELQKWKAARAAAK